MKSFLFSVLFLIPSIGFCNLEDDFLALKDSGISYEATGTVCEEVAQLQFEKKYVPEQYTVVTGIEYNADGRTIGELDLVIFDNASKKVVLVGEVKCWKNMSSGLKKAKDQRQRFLKYLRSSKAITFQWLKDKTAKITKPQFHDLSKFVSIAQKGAMASGYEYELPYTLNELMGLRTRLIRCQEYDDCAKPQ